MNVYFYDSFINENKNARTIAKIETRLTDLGLNGKIIRLGVIKSINNILKDEIRRGAKNIIGVGDNSLFYDLINNIAKINQNDDIVLGFIPVGGNNSMSKTLNIPTNEKACDLISARIIKNFQLSLANDNFFLFNAKIKSKNTNIEIDGDYSIEINKEGSFLIENLNKNQENKLNLKIKLKQKGFSFLGGKEEDLSKIPFQKLFIKSKQNQILLDDTKKTDCPSLIKRSNVFINVITGKML